MDEETICASWYSPFERVSSSCIWKAQKRFYEINGINSWEVVPEYMTSNAFIAHQYASFVISYLQDLINVCKFL